MNNFQIFNHISGLTSKMVTEKYSTSFSRASTLFKPEIRQHIYNIYGFVRFADEIVDTFHDYDKAKLLKMNSRKLQRCPGKWDFSQSYSSFFLYRAKREKYSSAFGRCVFAFYENGFGRYQGFE